MLSGWRERPEVVRRDYAAPTIRSHIPRANPFPWLSV
jgi:hypothetical protein